MTERICISKDEFRSFFLADQCGAPIFLGNRTVKLAECRKIVKENRKHVCIKKWIPERENLAMLRRQNGACYTGWKSVASRNRTVHSNSLRYSQRTGKVAYGAVSRTTHKYQAAENKN